MEVSVSEGEHGAGMALLGRIIKKKFGKKFFLGKIVDFDDIEKWYKVTYTDGDTEELEWSEVKTLLVDDPNVPREKVPEAKYIARRKRAKVFDEKNVKAEETTSGSSAAEAKPSGSNEGNDNICFSETSLTEKFGDSTYSQEINKSNPSGSILTATGFNASVTETQQYGNSKSSQTLGLFMNRDIMIESGGEKDALRIADNKEDNIRVGETSLTSAPGGGIKPTLNDKGDIYLGVNTKVENKQGTIENVRVMRVLNGNGIEKDRLNLNLEDVRAIGNNVTLQLLSTANEGGRSGSPMISTDNANAQSETTSFENPSDRNEKVNGSVTSLLNLGAKGVAIAEKNIPRSEMIDLTQIPRSHSDLPEGEVYSIPIQFIDSASISPQYASSVPTQAVTKTTLTQRTAASASVAGAIMPAAGLAAVLPSERPIKPISAKVAAETSVRISESALGGTTVATSEKTVAGAPAVEKTVLTAATPFPSLAGAFNFQQEKSVENLLDQKQSRGLSENSLPLEASNNKDDKHSAEVSLDGKVANQSVEQLGNAERKRVSKPGRKPAQVTGGDEAETPRKRRRERGSTKEEEEEETEDEKEKDGEKVEEANDVNGSDVISEPGELACGRKLKKKFGKKYYYGVILSYDPTYKWYKVKYEDGDREEMWWHELEPLLLESISPQNISPMKKSSLKKSIETKKRRRTSSISTEENDDVDKPNSMFCTMAGRYLSTNADEEIYGWGELAINYHSTPATLKSLSRLPVPLKLLTATCHHLAVLDMVGQVFVMRSKHGNIRSKCNQWEKITFMEEKNIVFLDISSTDIDRSASGYLPHQEDQVPDQFYLVALDVNGMDFVFAGSLPQEKIRALPETRHSGLHAKVDELYPQKEITEERITFLSVGTIQSIDEPPFIGYITSAHKVIIRGATNNFIEDLNFVSGFTGNPIKIQCGKSFYAIILTDDGKAWTWGLFPSSSSPKSNFITDSLSQNCNFSVCKLAQGSLKNKKVIDVGCFSDRFVALTEDGVVHNWSHNASATVLNNVPATIGADFGPKVATADKIIKVCLGDDVCAGVTLKGDLHTWRIVNPKSSNDSKADSSKEVSSSEDSRLTPLGRREGPETRVSIRGIKEVSQALVVPGSLLFVAKRRDSRKRYE